MNFKEKGWNPVPFKEMMNHAVWTKIVPIISEHLDFLKLKLKDLLQGTWEALS